MTNNQRLILGDALEELKKIESNSIDFVLTDPPYFIQEEVLINRSNKWKYKGKNIDFKKGTEWDRGWRDESEYLNWLEEIIKELARVLKNDRHIVMFCDKKKFSFIGKIGEKYGLKFRTPWFIRYLNPTPQARKVSPMKSVQIGYWGTKGKVKTENYNWQLGMISDVIECGIPQKEGSLVRHPTQKPLKVGLYLVAYLSKPGDLVLDPFAGVGTFPLACLLLKRNFIAIEKDEVYFKAMEQRLKSFNNSVKKIYIDFVKERLENHTKSVSLETVKELLGVTEIQLKLIKC